MSGEPFFTGHASRRLTGNAPAQSPRGILRSYGTPIAVDVGHLSVLLGATLAARALTAIFL
ncbi:hypothetical protein [Aureimonas sp. AU20]|uniref:hypothetical protein n=1 Tax=Aureimonas sp. AU20 TaxID=1349819 RepID=UPI000A46D7E2|nr:hypothetical protein [Aureimonas sp. AU20]